MTKTEEQQHNALTVKVAAQVEFDKIHQLNHETFAEEIPLQTAVGIKVLQLRTLKRSGHNRTLKGVWVNTN